MKAKFRPVKQCNCLKQVQLTQNTHQPETGSLCLSVCHMPDQRSSTKLLSKSTLEVKKSFKTITTGTVCSFSYKDTHFWPCAGQGDGQHDPCESWDSRDSPFPFTSPTRPSGLSGPDAGSACRASQPSPLCRDCTLVLLAFRGELTFN